MVVFFCKCVASFDGQNPRSIVIMDNASIHHVTQIQEITRSWESAHLLATIQPRPHARRFLQKYKQCCSKITMSRHSPEQFVRLAFSTVTKKDT